MTDRFVMAVSTLDTGGIMEKSMISVRRKENIDKIIPDLQGVSCTGLQG